MPLHVVWINKEEQEQPVAFPSWKLLDWEVVYTTIERVPGYHLDLEKLQPYLYGQEFSILTDHHP